jgi:LuxR family transcriptional regulator, maltose regulon positive regulatory protein
MRYLPTPASDSGDAPRAPAVCRTSVEAGHDPGDEINTIRAILVVVAALLLAQGDDDHARNLTPDVSDHEHVVLSFSVVSESGPLQRLSRRSTTPAGLVSDVIDLLGATAGSGMAPRQRELNPLPEALSDREMRILRYLPTHLSASEIAGELYISLNTAKTHFRHIYTKLGVNTRKDAVEQARLLRLLAP